MMTLWMWAMKVVQAYLEDRRGLNGYVAAAVLIVVAAALYAVWDQVGQSITSLVQNAINAIGGATGGGTGG